MKFGTDPVAIDRFLIDVIDNKRKQEGAISVWERDMKYFSTKLDDWQANPNVNRFIREPGHIEYASTLGLGVYDIDRRSSTRRSRYDGDRTAGAGCCWRCAAAVDRAACSPRRGSSRAGSSRGCS